MSQNIYCVICNYPHVKVRNGIKSITVATESRDPNTLHERTPVKFETSLYKDTAVCHMCHREKALFGSVDEKRIKKEHLIASKNARKEAK